MARRSNGQTVQNHPKPDPETFVLLSIDTQKRINAANGKPHFKGIHVVWDGFNAAFRIMFPDLDPRVTTAQMQADGKIRIFPVRGGAILLRPEDVTAKQAATPTNKLLQSMQLA